MGASEIRDANATAWERDKREVVLVVVVEVSVDDEEEDDGTTGTEG